MGARNTRRNWRKNRPQLSAGMQGVKGEVVKSYPGKQFGFIKPENGAAQILFYISEVPFDRKKCVGVGSTVFFDVVEQGVLIRKNYQKPKLVAKIRSRRPV